MVADKGSPMSKQRRVFTAEFKHEAASLVVDQDYSHAVACRSLDVTEDLRPIPQAFRSRSSEYISGALQSASLEPR